MTMRLWWQRVFPESLLNQHVNGKTFDFQHAVVQFTS